MRCSAILILAAVASVSAAGINRRQDATYPACSLPCLQAADFGTCDPLDDACLCKSSDFINSTTTCIAGACSGNDLLQAEAAAQSACEAVGVTLSSSAPAATSTAPASSASASASATVTITSAAAPSQTSNAASSRGVNALAALAAVGAAALAL
ncbi:hypothetical protein VTO73DRAFT_12490 [Trametes versicolor]